MHTFPWQRFDFSYEHNGTFQLCNPASGRHSKKKVIYNEYIMSILMCRMFG